MGFCPFKYYAWVCVCVCVCGRARTHACAFFFTMKFTIMCKVHSLFIYWVFCFVYEEWIGVSLERTSQCYLSCSIYPSQQEPGTVQIPIGNNTGSLPDLTSFHFPPPLPTPLDQEDPSSSPYSTVSIALLSAFSYFIAKLRLIVCHF